MSVLGRLAGGESRQKLAATELQNGVAVMGEVAQVSAVGIKVTTNTQKLLIRYLLAPLTYCMYISFSHRGHSSRVAWRAQTETRRTLLGPP